MKREDESMDFAKNLQLIRKLSNLSQEDVADQLHISRQAVSKWEIGQSTPDIDTCVKLCEILKVTPNRLLLGDEAEHKEAIPEKRNHWTTATVLYVVFLMVVCICGTILLVVNLYNGEIFEPQIHKMAIYMIKGSLYTFIITIVVVATTVITQHIRKKRGVMD